MTTSTPTTPIQPLAPVSDDKNLLAPAEGATCCGGDGCC